MAPGAGALPAFSGDGGVACTLTATGRRSHIAATLQPGENAGDLATVNFHRALTPDDHLGAGDFVLDGQLGGDTLADLFRRPTPSGEAFLLGRRLAGDAKNFVKGRVRPGFKQQRNDDHTQRTVFPPPRCHRRLPAESNTGMQDGFKLMAGGGIGKDEPRQSGPIQFPGGGQNAGAEGGADFRKRRLAGLDELAGQLIRVNDPGAKGEKKTGGGGFAHPHAAGKADQLHDAEAYWPPITAR